MPRYIVMVQNPHSGRWIVGGRFTTLANAIARRDRFYDAGYHSAIDARGVAA